MQLVFFNFEGFKIQAFLYTSVFYLIYVGMVMPHTEKVYNRLEIVNESLLILLAYHMFAFTPFVAEKDISYMTGWSAIVVIAVIIVLNITMMVNLGSKKLIRKVRMERLKKRRRAERAVHT